MPVSSISCKFSEVGRVPAPATPREAGPLRVDVGTPMLVVSRQNFDVSGSPVEFGRTWFRGIA